MNEKIFIFLMFLLSWSVLRGLFFLFLQITNGFEFSLRYFIATLLGLIAIPFSELWNSWWLFGILTLLYFLFGGGIITFTVLIVISIVLMNLPTIFAWFLLSKDKEKDK